jgi:uncharacterized protein
MLSDDIQKDLSNAQLARDEIKVSTLRLLLSEIKNAEISKGKLNEEDLISVIQKEAKKRKEASQAFRNGNREEQAQKEESELSILQSYLPQSLSTEELTKIVESSINEIGASSLSDMGRVMRVAMRKVSGRAEGGMVSSLVKEKLTNL